MIDNLFATGRIFLVRRPIRASLGPDTLFDRLMAGELGIDISSNREETYVIFTNKRRTMLLINEGKPPALPGDSQSLTFA